MLGILSGAVAGGELSTQPKRPRIRNMRAKFICCWINFSTAKEYKVEDASVTLRSQRCLPEHCVVAYIWAQLPHCHASLVANRCMCIHVYTV